MSKRMRQLIAGTMMVSGLLLFSPEAIGAPSGKGLHNQIRQTRMIRQKKENAAKVQVVRHCGSESCLIACGDEIANR